MSDTIEGTAPLKPDGLAVNGGAIIDENTFNAFWNLFMENRTSVDRQVEFTVEVKESWAELIYQMATYARAQFAVLPLRSFVIGIGVNHRAGTIRFLIFHRGGVTMSVPIKIIHERPKKGKGKGKGKGKEQEQEQEGGKGKEQEGKEQDQEGGKEKGKEPETEAVLMENRRTVLKIMLSILFWQGPVDAGLPPFTDGRSFLLPHPSNNITCFEVVIAEVLYYALSVRGRNTLVFRIHLPSDRFPLPPQHPWPTHMVTRAKQPIPSRASASRVLASIAHVDPGPTSRKQSGKKVPSLIAIILTYILFR